ncbi:MAG TPA: ABC transporter permease subunit [Steroidobacteraceae bacterium]|nr:ABC transporter permease subunit [Steroidobacteraceae bacterium]
MAGSIRAPARSEAEAPARAGPWHEAAQRLLARRGARVALFGLALLVLLALLGPSLSPWAPESLDWQHLARAPGFAAGHWFGTDRLGRDLYVRTLSGLRLSLLISVLATLVSLLIGIAWGALAGYAGARTDALLMRTVDVLYALPYLFIVIILTTLFPRGSLAVLLVALGAVGWLTTARIVRAETLILRRRAFVTAARATGLTPLAVLTRHVVPNLLGPVLVYATLTVPQMILFESFLSFLGLGVQEPRASLGNLILVGAQEMESAAWLLLIPAGGLVLLLVCLNFLGDALRDALDPREH